MFKNVALGLSRRSCPGLPSPHPSPPRRFPLPRRPPVLADTPRLHLISPRFPCCWQQRAAHWFIYASVIALDLRCPEAGFCFPPPGRRGSPSGPRSPAALQAKRRSDCSIRVWKDTSVLPNRSGADTVSPSLPASQRVREGEGE